MRLKLVPPFVGDGSHAFRLFSTDEEVEAFRCKVSSDMTRALTALVLASGFSVRVKR